MRINSLFQKMKAKLGIHWENVEAIVPPFLGGAARRHGPFQFKTQVAKGVAYEIEATTNLRNWISIFADVSAGEIEYVDSDASKFSYRFYRLNVGGIYSMNVIGYVTVTLGPGFSMLANPLVAANNSVAELFKEMPEGTALSKFDSRSHRLTENKIKLGRWTNPDEEVGLGEGVIFYNPTSDHKSLSFVGEVRQGTFSTPIPGGFSIQSSIIPQPGRLDTDLGFPIDEGDVIHLFDRDRQTYVLYPYDEMAWSSNPPIVSVGEAFWIAKESPKNWIRNLSIT